MTLGATYTNTTGTEVLLPGNVLLDAVTREPVPMAMQHLDLSGRASPSGALLRVTHRFKCEGDKPVEAIYVFMLPRYGTLRRFVVKGDGFEVESNLSTREDARKEYEEGMQEGHLSVLAETHLDGMVSLNVGQVKPDDEITVMAEIVAGVENQDDKFRFRFPFTLAPCFHDRAQATATPEGGKIELPDDIFGDLVMPEWKTTAEGLHRVSFKMHVEPSGTLDAVSSPSHRILVRPKDDGTAEIELAASADMPNRDLVIDVLNKAAEPTLFIDKKDKAPKTPDKAPKWVVSIPSSLVPKAKETPRQVCFVLDRSGSMRGSPMDSARLALKACLSALKPTDKFGLVRFDDRFEVFDAQMAEATDRNRKLAAKFLDETGARGGTRLAQALGEAVRVLGGPGGDIFLITDGEVFETGPIVEQASACGSRIHVLGIGEAAQDRFLESLARRTDGVSEMVGVTEDVAGTALDLFNAVRQPVRVDVKAVVRAHKKKAQEHTIGTVWDGRPILIMDNGQSGGTFKPTEITLGWGKNDKKVKITTVQESPAGLVALLWAGRQIEDLESAMDLAKEGPVRVSIENDLKQVSSDYGLASRVMSLSAVVKRIGDRAGEQPEQQIVPVGMPGGQQEARGVFGAQSLMVLDSWSPAQSAYCCSSGGGGMSFGGGGMSFGGGGGQSKGLMPSPTRPRSRGPRSRMVKSCNIGASVGGVVTQSTTTGDSDPVKCSSLAMDNHFAPDTNSLGPDEPTGRGVDCLDVSFVTTPAADTGGLVLMTALSVLESDGGLPDLDMEGRWIRTALLALWALQDAQDKQTTRYQMHLDRMADFLENNSASWPSNDGPIQIKLVSMLRAGSSTIRGDWIKKFRELGSNPDKATRYTLWAEVSTAISR